MKFAFDTLRATRKLVLKLVNGFSLVELNTIPKGFSNNMIWNIGHLVATQQLLVYGRCKAPFTVEQWIIDKFRKGTFATEISETEWSYIKAQLLESPDRLEKDYNKGVFGDYETYPTSYGVVLENLDGSINFNNVHEGLHLGVLMSMRKTFRKPFGVLNASKDAVFSIIQKALEQNDFSFERVDFDRPWGGFFVIDEKDAIPFIQSYFPAENAKDIMNDGRVSPKILVVAPEKRLSWQYHHRRSEVWRVVEGKVGIIRSQTDEQGDVEILSEGDKVVLSKGERHRLVGLDTYAVIAEVWQHVDSDAPSNEDDIVRLADDFGR